MQTSSAIILVALALSYSATSSLQWQSPSAKRQEVNQQEPAPEPYSFSYSAESTGGLSTHQESGDGSGRVTGFYTIQGEDGRERRVDYVADENGYRASVKTNEVGTRGESSADAQYIVQLPSAKQLEAAQTTYEQYKFLEDTQAAVRARDLAVRSRQTNSNLFDQPEVPSNYRQNELSSNALPLQGASIEGSNGINNRFNRSLSAELDGGYQINSAELQQGEQAGRIRQSKVSENGDNLRNKQWQQAGRRTQTVQNLPMRQQMELQFNQEAAGLREQDYPRQTGGNLRPAYQQQWQVGNGQVGLVAKEKELSQGVVQTGRLNEGLVATNYGQQQQKTSVLGLGVQSKVPTAQVTPSWSTYQAQSNQQTQQVPQSEQPYLQRVPQMQSLISNSFINSNDNNNGGSRVNEDALQFNQQQDDTSNELNEQLDQVVAQEQPNEPQVRPAKQQEALSVKLTSNEQTIANQTSTTATPRVPEGLININLANEDYGTEAPVGYQTIKQQEEVISTTLAPIREVYLDRVQEVQKPQMEQTNIFGGEQLVEKQQEQREEVTLVSEAPQLQTTRPQTQFVQQQPVFVPQFQQQPQVIQRQQPKQQIVQQQQKAQVVQQPQYQQVTTMQQVRPQTIEYNQLSYTSQQPGRQQLLQLNKLEQQQRQQQQVALQQQPGQTFQRESDEPQRLRPIEQVVAGITTLEPVNEETEGTELPTVVPTRQTTFAPTTTTTAAPTTISTTTARYYQPITSTEAPTSVQDARVTIVRKPGKVVSSGVKGYTNQRQRINGTSPIIVQQQKATRTRPFQTGAIQVQTQAQKQQPIQSSIGQRVVTTSGSNYANETSPQRVTNRLPSQLTTQLTAPVSSGAAIRMSEVRYVTTATPTSFQPLVATAGGNLTTWTNNETRPTVERRPIAGTKGGSSAKSQLWKASVRQGSRVKQQSSRPARQSTEQVAFGARVQV